LLERPTEAGVQYRPPYRERMAPSRKPRVSLSRVLTVVCLVGLAASTTYLTYRYVELYDKAYGPSDQSFVKQIAALNRSVTELKGRLEKFEKFNMLAAWLNETTIVCDDVFYPKPPNIRTTFPPLEQDKRYRISPDDWKDFRVEYKITRDAKTIVEGPVLVKSTQTQPWTFDLGENLKSSKFEVGSYSFTIHVVTEGRDKVIVASKHKLWKMQKDVWPPIIKWIDGGKYSGPRLITSATVYDQESDVKSVEIVYSFVWIVGNRSILHVDKKPMQKSSPSGQEYFFSFADGLPQFKVREANITLYFIMATDNANNTAYSEPVRMGSVALSLSLSETPTSFILFSASQFGRKGSGRTSSLRLTEDDKYVRSAHSVYSRSHFHRLIKIYAAKRIADNSMEKQIIGHVLASTLRSAGQARH